jgi:hypothetical protein
MRIDPEDVRRHYESLSDEGLLDIERSDLAPVALGIYDQEIARRGLNHPPEREEEAGHRPLPVFQPGEDGDFASEPGADTDDGPPPAWLDDAACPWSAYIHPNADYIGTGAEVQTALREAGIPSHIVVKPPEPEPPSAPRSLYCVMVPGELGARAYSVVERKVFNRIAEAEWRSQLQAFSDEQLRALNPEDIWGALLDKAERMKRAYMDEIARRKLHSADRQGR